MLCIVAAFALLWMDGLFPMPPWLEDFIGYLWLVIFPEAFINMLALLGWNPGTEQEIFSMQELIDNFSLERVSKSGARFQPDKAKWFNAQYMHHKSDAELAALYQPILRGHGIEVGDEVAGRAAGIMKGILALVVFLVPSFASVGAYKMLYTVADGFFFFSF